MKCKTNIKEIERLRGIWREGHHIAKFRFAHALPGYIQAATYVKNDHWQVQAKEEVKNGKIKYELFNVDTAYMVREIGQKYAEYVYHN